MALGTRELLLVIRARDEASRVLGRMGGTLRNMDKDAMQAANDLINRGGALVSLGAGMAGIGGAAIAGFNAAIDAAAEYETQARRALTQTGDIKISLAELKDIGRDVARDIPAPFEKMQESLYTIFSTIDADAPQARRALRELARSAVASQTDLQYVTEGSLQVLNGFGLSIDDVGRVSDVMFETVEEGVGTFEEFVTNMGKAVPSAKRAGQQVEDLAGMMAFLTKNGLSGAMAATSSARAFDLIANPKVIDRLEKMNIKVTDSQGNFRSMSEIVSDLGREMEDMSAPERAEALGELFKGSGNNVQARRFFDLAIPGFKQLNDLTGQMVDSSGNVNRAYDIMLGAPATKAQELSNKFEILKTEIGDRLLPVKYLLIDALSTLLGWWNKIPGPVQNVIIIIGGVTAVLLTLAGIATMVGGALMILEGSLAIFGIGLGTAFAAVGIFLGAMAAIGVAVYLVIKYWDDIKAATIATWEAIKGWFEQNLGDQIQAIEDFAQHIWETLKGVWDDIVDIFDTAMDDIAKQWDKFSELTKPAREFWDEIFPYVKKGFNILKGIFTWGLKIIQFLWDFFLRPIVDGVKLVFTGIGNIIEGGLQFIQGILDFFLNLFTGHWGDAWDGLVSAFQGIGKMLLGAIQAIFGAIWTWLSVTALGKIVSILKGGVMLLFNAGKGLITGLLGGVKSLGGVIWGWFRGLLTTVWNWIKGFVPKMAEGGMGLLKGLWNGIVAAAKATWDFFKALPGKILSFVQDIGIWLYTRGSALARGLWDGIVAGAKAVWDWMSSLPGKLWDFVKDAGKWLLDTGRALLEGLWNGITGAASWLWDKIVGWLESIWDDIKSWFGISSPSKRMMEIGRYVVQGFASGITGTTKQAVAATRSLAEKVYDAMALKKEGLGGAAGRRILAAINYYDNRLVDIAKRREAIAVRMKAAQKALQAAIKVRADYAAGITQEAKDFAAITNLDAEGGDLAEQMRTRLEQITAFRENLESLLKMGLNKTMYKQIADAGVEAGGALAASLVADGPESVKEISRIQAQIDAQSKALGVDAAQTMYGAGVEAANGLTRGLASQAAALAKQAKSTANVLITEIKRALGIRSPSAVFADLGVQSMLGMAEGLLKAAPTAAAAAAVAAGMVSDSFSTGMEPLNNFSMSNLNMTPGDERGPRPGDDGTPPPAGTMVPITIYTNEINPLQHAAELGDLVSNRVS